MEIDTIPQIRVYLRGEKKRPKIYREEIDLNKMWKFVSTYFSSKINIEPFTKEEIDQITLELMEENDQDEVEKK